jgi:hypothetical protein
VFVVAIASLAGSLDSEGPRLATELGVSAYDVRQRFASGFPVVAWAGADEARAAEVLARLRGRGHSAIGCDTATVVPSERMVSLRDFRIVEGGVSADEASTLPWDDVLCLLRAVQRRMTETTTTETERKFSAGTAMLSGGLLVRRTKTKEVVHASEDREQVLYLFRRSGAVPWILRETSTRYAALGPLLVHATLQNFLTTIRVFRERTPHAVYDERLLTLKSPDPVVAAHGGIDLLAHLTALCLAASHR